LPADLAAEMSASEALLVGVGGAFLAVLAGAAIAEPEEAGAALAEAAGVEAGLAAGAGVDAGADVEVAAGAAPEAEAAIPESAFLLFFDDFVLEPVLAAGVA